jgi:hypothetical protein
MPNDSAKLPRASDLLLRSEQLPDRLRQLEHTDDIHAKHLFHFLLRIVREHFLRIRLDVRLRAIRMGIVRLEGQAVHAEGVPNEWQC